MLIKRYALRIADEQKRGLTFMRLAHDRDSLSLFGLAQEMEKLGANENEFDDVSDLTKGAEFYARDSAFRVKRIV